MTPDVPDVLVFDTTLRLGVQGTGFHPSLGDALAVVRLLDELGVAYAEIGDPADNPRAATLFARAQRELSPALTLVAHASLPLDDAALRVLVASGARTVALSVVASQEWVTRVLGVDVGGYVAQVRAAVAALRAEGMTVVLDAEHAFSGPLVAEVLDADVVTLCDSLGGALPWQVEAGVAAALVLAPVIGVQCHDDGGMAVANTLAAVHAGARLVQVALGGYGPRSGTAALASVVAGVETKLGLTAVARLDRLQHVSHAVSEIAHEVPDAGAPYVGTLAFAHRAGSAAVTAAPDLAQHVDPSRVGNAMTLHVTGAAGTAGVELKARALGVEVPPDVAPRVADAVRRAEGTGLSYEAAEASFELLLRAEVDGRAPRVFDLESWRVIVERRADGQLVSEATVKLYAAGERIVATGEGNGPVNALDTAIRKALGELHPGLERLQLVDYKVRILDTGHGTGAVTRVLITTGDGEREWVTVGAGANVIDASWQALDDALTYGLIAAGRAG
jgi:2-isopropylmalate synthase